MEFRPRRGLCSLATCFCAASRWLRAFNSEISFARMSLANTPFGGAWAVPSARSTAPSLRRTWPPSTPRIPIRTSPRAPSRHSRKELSTVKHAPTLCDIGCGSGQAMWVFKQASSWNRTRSRRTYPRKEIWRSLRGSRVNKAVEPDCNPSFLPQQNHGIDSQCLLCRDPSSRQPDEQHRENYPAQHQRIFRRRLVHDRGKQLRRQHSQNQSCR
jgi:hypothetical protein